MKSVINILGPDVGVMARRYFIRMLKCFLVVNKQGKVRVARHYDTPTEEEDQKSTEKEMIRKVLSHKPKQCAFLEFRDLVLVYRRYLNLYFILVIDRDENELAIYEFIHCIVETMDKYFNRVTEVAIVYNVDRVHMILDEMILNGQIVETSITRTLAPLQLLDTAKK